jgi:hypothetical protein
MSPNIYPIPAAQDPWAESTYEGAELAQLLYGARLTFDEKVSWLEQAHRISLQFQENRRKQGLPTIYTDGRIEL